MSFFRKSDAAMLRTAYELSAGVLSFVVALGIGWWVGRALDRAIGSAPWMTALCTAIGFAAGVLNVVRTVSRAVAAERPGGPPPGNGGD